MNCIACGNPTEGKYFRWLTTHSSPVCKTCYESLQEDDDMADNVNHPEHYTQGKIECIDAIEAAVGDMPPVHAFLLANVIKYCWRWHRKGGVESLRKARWYLDRAIERAVE